MKRSRVTWNYIMECYDAAGRMLDSSKGQCTTILGLGEETSAKKSAYRTAQTQGQDGQISWLEAYGWDAFNGLDPNRIINIDISRWGFSPFGAAGEGT